MNIIFLTLSQAIRNISNRGIYPDLLRKFVKEGHQVYIVCPSERRLKQKTKLTQQDNLSILSVATLNITKTNIVEKGIGTLLIEYQFLRAIDKHFSDVEFDLVLYSTPPITFNSVIEKIKNKSKARTYLLLKDIFPQNALDLGMLSKRNPMYWLFKRKEKKLYALSDKIGCMSPANVEYILDHNPEVPRSKMEVCPNAIELVDSSETIDKAAIRNKYNIPTEAVVCMYGGNLGKPQGIDFLIKVLETNQHRKDVYFVVAGNGTEFGKLQAFQKSKNPNNFLLLSSLPKLEYDVLLASCNVGLILLDKRFTIPNYPSRLLNYLEFKIPVLMATDKATDVGRIAEENNYGYWSLSGDLEGFNQALNRLVSSSDVRKEMGENGYQFLLDNYIVDRSYETIMSHFLQTSPTT